MNLRIFALAILLAMSCGIDGAQRAKQTSTTDSARTLTVLTEPNAIVWVDDIRRGTTDTGGRLASMKLSSGAHALRVRAGIVSKVSELELHQRRR